MDLDSLLAEDAPQTTAPPLSKEESSVYVHVPTGDIYLLNEHGHFEGMNGTGHPYVEGIEKLGLKPAYDSCSDEAVTEVWAAARELGVEQSLYARWRQEGAEDLNWYQIAQSWEWLDGIKKVHGIKDAAGMKTSTAEAVDIKAKEQALKVAKKEPPAVVAEILKGTRVEGYLTQDDIDAGAATVDSDGVVSEVPTKVEAEVVVEAPAPLEPNAAEEAADALGLTHDEAMRFEVKDLKTSEWFKARIIFWQAVVDNTVKMACVLIKKAVGRRNRLMAAYGNQHKQWLINAKDAEGKDLMERYSRGEKKGQLKAKNHQTLIGGTYFKKSGGVFRSDSHELALEVQKLPEWKEAEELKARCAAVGINVSLSPALKFWNAKAKEIDKDNQAKQEQNATIAANMPKHKLEPLPAGYTVAPVDETKFMTIGVEKGWSLKQALDPLRQIQHLQDSPLAGYIEEDENGEETD